MDFSKIFEMFFFLDFFVFFVIPFKVTKVTTKRYQGYYWTPNIAKNMPKQHNKILFCQKSKNSLGKRTNCADGEVVFIHSDQVDKTCPSKFM